MTIAVVHLSLGGGDDLFHLSENLIRRLCSIQLVNQVQLLKVPGRLMPMNYQTSKLNTDSLAPHLTTVIFSCSYVTRNIIVTIVIIITL